MRMKVSIVSLLPCLLLAMLFSFASTVSAAAEDCFDLDKNSGAPISGFGAAYNVHSTAKELLIDVSCDRSNRAVVVSLGNNSQNQYIYEKGYIAEETSTNVWTDWLAGEVTFQGTPVLDPNTNQPSGWLANGSATLNTTRPSASLDRKQAVLAYMCNWNGSAWKCGCANATCNQGLWQLQFFEYPPAPAATTTQPQTRTFNISGSGTTFSNTSLTVNQGDTVVINFSVNSGVHDIKFDAFNASTDLLSQGESETIQFVANQKGTFEYYCSPHRSLGMVGTLIVN